MIYQIRRQDSANLIKILFYRNPGRILINKEIHITETGRGFLNLIQEFLY